MSQKVAKGHDKEFVEKYGRSAKENFGVIDTIGVPHAYMITPKHLEYNQDEMYIGTPQIERMEKEYGPMCGQLIKEFTGAYQTTRCNLKYGEHQQALLVECLKEPKNDNEYGNELQTYLKKIIEIPHFKEKGFVGFTLMDSFGSKK